MTNSTPTRSVYVPPHLRNRPASSPSATSSYDSPATPPSASGSRTYSSAPNRSTSRTPWSASASSPHPSSPQANGPSSSLTPTRSSSSHPGRSYYEPSSSVSASRRSYGGTSSASAGNVGSSRDVASVDSRNRSNHSFGGGSSNGYSTSPHLYVYGDSFVGPFKLLTEDCVKVQTFKGSSAKGLNNPNSIKQVSRDLVPILNHLLAPPPYAYMPSSGRWALLIFGNVDLQINYLWQLANKPISSLSAKKPDPALEEDIVTRDISALEEDGNEEDVTSGEAQGRQDPSRRASNVLATATENSAKGPALGPEAFVENVVKAYTTWLEREIINGPIGKRLSENAEQRRSADSSTNNANPSISSSGPSRRRLPPPSKVLIAAALPPLIEDELLPRIPEKYVERLEEDHERAQRAFDRASASASASEDREGGSRTPWARNGNGVQDGDGHGDGSPRPRNAKLAGGDIDELEVGLSTLNVSDNPRSPLPPELTPPTSASSSSGKSTLFDTLSTAISDSTAATTEDFPSLSPLSTKSTFTSSTLNSSSAPGKTPILTLLDHNPPLCTLPIRVRMTNQFNNLIRAFCARHPDILSFIDISSAMFENQPADMPSLHGEVDRGTWACPVDPTNVHPLWEPTLPLWRQELEKEGLPTDSWRINEDAEETFKAYESDKRRRTERGAAERGERIKLRDE
ncbi:hypothetical protein I317_07837 [Kwoniella heveanensis CBS 569]|nr:hypothetical protein I317_07837 [Kwoniella heveanensis CBS 569]